MGASGGSIEHAPPGRQGSWSINTPRQLSDARCWGCWLPSPSCLFLGPARVLRQHCGRWQVGASSFELNGIQMGHPHWGAYSFPTAAVPTDCHLSGLNQCILIISLFGKSKAQDGAHQAKSRCWQGCIFSEAAAVSLSFPLCSSCPFSLASGPFVHLQSQVHSIFQPVPHLRFYDPLSSDSYKEPHDDIGPTWIV